MWSSRLGGKRRGNFFKTGGGGTFRNFKGRHVSYSSEGFFPPREKPRCRNDCENIKVKRHHCLSPPPPIPLSLPPEGGALHNVLPFHSFFWGWFCWIFDWIMFHSFFPIIVFTIFWWMILWDFLKTEKLKAVKKFYMKLLFQLHCLDYTFFEKL